MAYLPTRSSDSVPLTCYVGSPLTPPSSPVPKSASAPVVPTKDGLITEKQIMDKLNAAFGPKPVISYWALLTFVVVWMIFAVVIFIIFTSAGKTGWGFYYLVQILFLALIIGIIVWLFCSHGYSTVAWVISGISIAVAIGFIIWASVAYPQIKKLGRSPFG